MALAFILTACSRFPNILNQQQLLHYSEDSVLVIGCIIMERWSGTGYHTSSSYHPTNPFIAILGFKAEDSTSNELKQFWIKTDSDGYYALPNAPRGEYFLAGVGTISSGEIVRIPYWFDPKPYVFDDEPNWSDPEKSDPWHSASGLSSGDYTDEDSAKAVVPLIRAPKVWPIPSDGDVYNLDYLILTDEHLLNGIELHSYIRSSLNSEQFTRDIEYNRPTVPEYFIGKYPGSGWASRLRDIMK